MSKDLEVIRQLEKQTGKKLKQVEIWGTDNHEYLCNDQGRVAKLWLASTNLQDLSPLASPSALTNLGLYSNKIEDL